MGWLRTYWFVFWLQKRKLCLSAWASRRRGGGGNSKLEHTLRSRCVFFVMLSIVWTTKGSALSPRPTAITHTHTHTHVNPYTPFQPIAPLPSTALLTISRKSQRFASRCRHKIDVSPRKRNSAQKPTETHYTTHRKVQRDIASGRFATKQKNIIYKGAQSVTGRAPQYKNQESWRTYVYIVEKFLWKLVASCLLSTIIVALPCRSQGSSFKTILFFDMTLGILINIKGHRKCICHRKMQRRMYLCRDSASLGHLSTNPHTTSVSLSTSVRIVFATILSVFVRALIQIWQLMFPLLKTSI